MGDLRSELTEAREDVRRLILANFRDTGRYGYRLDPGQAADDVLAFLVPLVTRCARECSATPNPYPPELLDRLARALRESEANVTFTDDPWRTQADRLLRGALATWRPENRGDGADVDA